MSFDGINDPTNIKCFFMFSLIITTYRWSLS